MSAYHPLSRQQCSAYAGTAALRGGCPARLTICKVGCTWRSMAQLHLYCIKLQQRQSLHTTVAPCKKDTSKGWQKLTKGSPEAFKHFMPCFVLMFAHAVQNAQVQQQKALPVAYTFKALRWCASHQQQKKRRISCVSMSQLQKVTFKVDSQKHQYKQCEHNTYHYDNFPWAGER